MTQNIVSFYIYRISSRLYFHLAVLFVYFYANNMDTLMIELLLASYGIMLMASSQWKVKLAGYISEKYIITLGELVKAAGLIFLTFKFDFWLLLIGQLLSGIGYSLTAGTDSSLLKNLLAKQNPDRYKKIESSSNSFMFLAFLFAGIVGSILFSLNEYYVFYFSIISNLISIIAILSIKAPNTTKVSKREAEIRDNIADNGESLSAQSFWKTYYAISRAFPLAIFVGFLPYFLFVGIEIDLYFFGLILSLFTFAGFLAARYFAKLTSKFDYKLITLITMGLSVISMLLLGIVNNVYISTVVVFLLGLASGGVRPLTLIHLNTNHLAAQERISLFSSMEKLYGFWNAALLIIGGFLFSLIGFQYLMICFALLYTVLLFIFYKKYHFSLTTLNSIPKGESQ